MVLSQAVDSDTARVLGSPVRSAKGLRIAFVLGQLGMGGTETQAQVLVRGLLARGADVDVFVVEGGVAQGDFGSARVVELSDGRRRGARGAIRLALCGVRLGRALRARRYDVVHAALDRACLLAPLAAPVRHRPRVVTWRRNLGYHLDRRPLAAALEWCTARLTDVVISNSYDVGRYWSKRGHIRPAQGRVVSNAVEDWRFERTQQPGNGPRVPRLLAVGGLRPIKGHGVLIDAAARLAQQGVPVEVVIAGDGSERASLETRAAASGVKLVAPGEVRDTRGLLGSCAIYLQPSLSEGSSNAVAEAMACGCAVVATDVGGTAEMLGGAGVLVPPGDAAAIAREVRDLLADPGRRAKLGAAAQTRARELFSLDAVLDRHLAIYSGA